MSDQFAMGDLAADPEQLARERAIRFRSNASNMAIQPPDYQVGEPQGVPPDFAMGSLAAQDAYRPLGNDPWTGLMRGQTDQPLGGVLAPPSPTVFKTASPLANITQADLDRGVDLALSFSGGGLATRGISHGISSITLPDTVQNLAKLNRTIPTKDIVEKTITPHDIPEGSWLTPLIGDRSISGQLITHVGGKELENPVWAQGGYQFMPEWQKQQIGWASDAGPSTKLANRISGLAAQDTPGVYGVYTAMGPQSIDASHHVSDTLSQMMKLEKPNISKTAAEQFDAKMAAVNPDFPGIKSSKLQPYLRQQTMDFRNFFAKTMDQRAAQEAGFPDVAQARIAATHPELMDLPSYSGGQAMAKMTGDVIHGSQGFGLAPHYTYRSKLPGEYVGGLAAPLPKDILWPDLAAKIATRIPSAEARIWMAGPLPQRVTPQWQDTAAEWLRRNRMGDVARQY